MQDERNTEETTANGAEVDETEVSDTTSLTSDSEVQNEPLTDGEEAGTFPRSYVEELRQENGKYRQRAQRADELAHRLHRALVVADGRLQDATDLPFDEEHLDDAEKLSNALDDLLTKKPHLASRRPAGDIGQGATTSAAPVDLAGMLRARA
jgi:hypothetical protein